MTSITLSLPEELKSQLKRFSWVNWSEIAREEMRKKLILEDYIKTGSLSDEDWEFCEDIDWHPVDELPLREEFVEKLVAIRKEKPIRYTSVTDFFKKLK